MENNAKLTNIDTDPNNEMVALRTRIETWIANAYRNNRDDQNKLNGTSINRLYIIDGMFARNLRIEAWKDVLKVMR